MDWKQHLMASEELNKDLSKLWIGLNRWVIFFKFVSTDVPDSAEPNLQIAIISS